MTPFLVCRLLTFFTCVVLVTTSDEESTSSSFLPYKVKLTTGLYLKKPLVQPLIYSQTTPLFFNFTLDHMPKAHYSHHLMRDACKDQTTDKPEFLSCVLYQDMEEKLLYTQASIDFMRIGLTGLNSLSYTSMAPLTNRTSRQILAGLVGAVGFKFVSDLFSGSEDTETVYKDVTKSIASLNSNVIKEGVAITEIERKTINQMHLLSHAITAASDLSQAMNDTIYKEIQTGRLRELILSSHIVQELLRLADNVRMSSVVEACKNNQIPSAILSPVLLRRELLILQGELLKHKHALSINPNSVSEYFARKICKCSINAKSGLVTMVVNIPIKRLHQSLELFELVSIPFLQSEKTLCSLELENSNVVIDGDKFPIVISGSALQTCGLGSSECKFHEYNFLGSKSDLCIDALIRGMKIGQLSKFCSYSCQEIHHVTPILQQLSDNTYAITNIVQPLTMTCFTGTVFDESEVSTKHLLQPLQHNAGVYLLKVGCNCRVTVGDELILQPPLLCKQEEGQSLVPTLHYALPHIYSKVDDTFIAKATTIERDLARTETYKKVAEIIDLSKLQVDVTNLTLDPVNTKFNLPQHLYTYRSIYQQYGQLILNALFCAAILYLYAQLQGARQKLPVLYSLLQAPPTVQAICPGHHELHSYLGLFITLGLLNFFVIAMFLFMIYCICKRRWSRTSSGIDCTYNSADPREPPYLPPPRGSRLQGSVRRGRLPRFDEETEMATFRTDERSMSRLEERVPLQEQIDPRLYPSMPGQPAVVGLPRASY